MTTSYVPPGATVEVSIVNPTGANGYGGDFALDSSGDWILAIDQDVSPAATNERLIRLILSNKNLSDQFGNPIGFADDIYHVNWGSGLKAYIGQNFNQQGLNNLTNDIFQQLSTDPGVSPSVPPLITLTPNGVGAVVIAISYMTVFGQPATLPTLTVSAGGAVSTGSGGV